MTVPRPHKAGLVAVFAFDRDEPSQVRTIRAIQASGAQVRSLSFHRENMPRTSPDWQDIPLGRIANGTGPRRLFGLAVGAIRALAKLGQLGRPDILVARNLDMALLAVLCGMFLRHRPTVIYQCLDVHPVLRGSSLKSRLAREAERFVLSRADRVVVSSPEFVSRHLHRLAPAATDFFLMENRILWTGPPPQRATVPDRTPGPVRLGWVGTLRCPQSFGLLLDVADRMGSEIEIIMRGVVHQHMLPDFSARIAQRSNVHYQGGYTYPQGLADAYDGLDLAWGQELWDRGGNTDWLLPNRLYEAGYFGCPLIAISGSRTADRIAADGGGIILDRADADELARRVCGLPPGVLRDMRRQLLARPEADFCILEDETSSMLDTGSPAPERNRCDAVAA